MIGAIDINVLASDIVFPFHDQMKKQNRERTVTSYISGDNFWTHFTNNKTNPKQLYEYEI